MWKEAAMIQPRRVFLRFLGVTSSLVVGSVLPGAQGKHKFPEPPQPAEPGGETTATNDQSRMQRAQLKLNEKEFRESLGHLYDRVSELKQDLETVHTADVFSLKVYKQTDEIEHLAKRLRSLARV
jgi:hypothetical protein